MIVKFKDVGYKELRACKNNLTYDLTKTLGNKFYKSK